MGAFLAHLVDGALKEVQISYQGDLSDIDTAPVTVSILKSLLAPVLREDVNFVNAPIVAKERGIKVVESKSGTCETFNNLLEIATVTTSGRNSLAGTIFGKTEPRLVRINDFSLEAVPEGHMLLIYNEDRPGVIGRIGMTLGKSGPNIARMQVGQDPDHNRNVILLTTDEPASKDVTQDLLQQDGVTDVISVEL
jgi:D-3-phosphoglycerate dehydrogenase